MTESLWTGRSSNRKTGDIPQQFIGLSREESKASCTGCPLLADKSCYAHFGSEAWGHSAMIKASARGKDYSLDNALSKRAKTAKYVRLGAIGDPCVTPIRAIAQTVKSFGLGLLSYTHFWRDNQDLKALAMASCDQWTDVVDAVKMGFRATLHVKPEWLKTNGTKGSINGVKFAQCPNQTHGTTCNDCGLCDPTRTLTVPVIIFQEH